jgi:hypothetical protein
VLVRDAGTLEEELTGTPSTWPSGSRRRPGRARS